MNEIRKGSEFQGLPENSYVVPGLVDIHCHGVAGLDVMEGWAREIGARLRTLGIEYYCPTTVCAPWSELRTFLESVRQGFPGFAGVHLEGPFINSEKSGAQPAGHIRAPNIAEFKRELGELSGLIKIATIAPELPGGAELAMELSALGIRVQAGHTDATFSELSHAKHISGLTHFYNAMRPLGHREPGAVGYGLLNDIDCELIYDRIHVSREAAEILIKCKSANRIIGVSDGTKLSGMEDGAKAQMWGLEVWKEDGCARLPSGTLAGSASTQMDVFQNMWADFGIEAAVAACSVNPRKALNLPAPSMWLVMSADGRLLRTLEGDLTSAAAG